jgi:hypothetical protein
VNTADLFLSVVTIGEIEPCNLASATPQPRLCAATR